MDDKADALSSIYDIAAAQRVADPIDEFALANSSRGTCRFQRQHGVKLICGRTCIGSESQGKKLRPKGFTREI